MAAPSYTYQLTNGTTADATQVMQDFNDILNAVTDGTKDLTFNALTANGAANLKAAVTLGASTANLVTWNGALNTSIPINTDNSFDIGTSSKGLRAIYFGANSFRVNIVGSSSMSATWTLTLPVAAATANQIFGGNNGATGAEWKTLAVGTTGTDFAVAHSANTVTFNLPDAAAGARGAVTNGTQTLAGAKTFTSLAALAAGSQMGGNTGVSTHSPVISGKTMTIDGTITPLTASGAVGYLFIHNHNTAEQAIYQLNGANNTTTEISDPSSAYNSTDSTSNNRIIWDGSNYSIHNAVGSNRTYTILFLSLYNGLKLL